MGDVFARIWKYCNILCLTIVVYGLGCSLKICDIKANESKAFPSLRLTTECISDASGGSPAHSSKF